MDVKRDYYAVLGLSKTATTKEIKQAFRTLAQRYHPDVTKDPSTAKRFQEIQEAYNILGDREQREAYDRWRIKEGLDQKPALVLKTVLSNQTLPCLAEEQILYVLVKLRSAEDVKTKRLPLNLCLVLDRSTSMQGTRLRQVKEATSQIIDQLSDLDVFSLVTFSDKAEVVLSGQRSVDKRMARSKVSTIRSWGGTEILQGLLAGLRELEKWRSPETVNHLILLTDGQTYGDEEGCLRVAEDASARQIAITAMGIGVDWNDKLLDEMAAKGGGLSVYIDTPASVPHIFHERIKGLSNVFAQNLSLSLRFGEGAALRDAFGLTPQITRLRDKNGSLPLGMLEFDQTAMFLLEVLVSPRQPGQHRLLQLTVTGDIPALGRQHERASQEVVVDFATPPLAKEVVPPSIVSALGKLSIYKIQAKAVGELERGEIERATHYLKAVATRLLNIGEAELAKAALLEAGRVSRTGHLSPGGKKKLKYGTRSLSILPREVDYDYMP